MQTRLPDKVLPAHERETADAILRSCVHCGFCTATCPTYQQLGDELDSPRGRIYLIKQALETGQASRTTLLHLDRCLQCRNCETTCPSGVQYIRLLEIGKNHLARQVQRPWRERLLRRLLAFALPRRRLNRQAFRLAQWLRPLLPRHLAGHLPQRWQPARLRSTRPTGAHVVLFQGCVESTLMGAAHQATVRLLAATGHAVRYLAEEQCCGAVELHLDRTRAARQRALANLAQWRQALDEGAEAIVLLSSACLLQARQYPELLGAEAPDDLQALLARVMGLDQWLQSHSPQWTRAKAERVAWHPPYTLQHGLKQATAIPQLLREAGYQVQLPDNAHLCCGAAGTYTLLQAELSAKLGTERRQAMQALQADWISTANIGCLLQLQADEGPPVRHWAELLARRLPEQAARQPGQEAQT